MATPEHPNPHAPEKMPLIKKLLHTLGIQLAEEKFREEVKKAAEKWREGQQYETKTKRKQVDRKQQQKERKRNYHKAKSAEVKEMEAHAARLNRIAQIEDKLIERDNPNTDPEGSRDLMDQIRDPRVRRAIDELINSSPSAAEAIYTLVTEGREIHGNPRELLNLAQTLSYEAATKTPTLFDDLKPMLTQISKRVGELLDDELEVKQKAARDRGRGQQPSTYLDLLEEDPNLDLSAQEKKALEEPERVGDRIDPERTRTNWKRKIDEIITIRRDFTPEQRNRAQQVAQEGIGENQTMIGGIVAPIDKLWGEIERKEAEGQLTTDDLLKYSQGIQAEAAKIYPKDVPAGSEDYARAVKELRAFTEAKQQLLADRLLERLKTEKPLVRAGITDIEKFLVEMGQNKGRLGGLLEMNPEMYKLFKGTDGKSRKFRDRVFLAIHSSIISDQRNASHENFGLYERADFTTFTDLLRLEVKITVGETGRPLGDTLSDHYNTLSNAIRQCRDIDYWASQPGGNTENWNKSLGMFQNEYVRLITLMPGVNAAFRAYETVLRSIKTANDGYIPAALIEYDPVTKTGFWDNWSRDMLDRMIHAGVVPDVERDPLGLEKAASDGYGVQLSKDALNLQDVSPEERKMYMTLAKGFGIATARYLEIIASSKMPGTKHPEKGIERWHSLAAYEGVAKGLNYFNIYVDKWQMGAYKYFYLLNQVIPKEKRINPENRTDGIQALMAYQDGTFEEKYGADAKRFVDLTNFSGISSAIGKDTYWRQFDSTAHWSDRQREMLGGPTQMVLAKRYVTERVKELLVVAEYKEKYRQQLIKQNQEKGTTHPTSGSPFDKLWKEYGLSRYGSLITKKWDEYMGKSPAKGQEHTPLADKTHHLINAYVKAFKTKAWIEMAMRNPLVVAHNLKVDMPLVGIDGGGTKTKKMTLHQVLVQDILGIPPEDTKYGEDWGKAGESHTPTEEQRKYMFALLTLEGDIAAVKEQILHTEGRDLTEDDFNVIQDKTRRNQAKEYWRRVRQVMLGTDRVERAGELYKEMGLELLENGENYAWDAHKIHTFTDDEGGILKTMEETFNKRDTQKQLITPIFKIIGQDGRPIKVPFLLKHAVEMEPEWILGTDDMAFNQMDLLTLGSRQLLRRGGDIAAHEQGGMAAVEYLQHGLIPTPDKQKLAEMGQKIVAAYSGDAIEAGWSVVSNLALMTDKLYAWDWSRLGSTAQLDLWRTRRGVAAWTANGRREFWDALEHMDVLPPHAHFYTYDWIDDKTTIHTLKKLAHADNIDVWKEILTLGVLLAIGMTLWRSFTAPSEEDEGGGGGGGHH